VWTMYHSVAFDFSVWEIFGCLLTGGRLVVVPFWTTRSPTDFFALLVDEQVTVINQTPSAFGPLIAEDREWAASRLALRLVIFGGEPLPVGMLSDWLERHPPDACRLVNMYGITETTVHVTATDVGPEEVRQRSRSVGRALPGWSVSVRDEAGAIVPDGVAGEIHIGGAGLAIGYAGEPELTAAHFLTDATGERRYRSGDLGRVLPDGTLEHLGRMDQQIKLRGFRIELDEIRSVLLEDPVVIDAAVVVRSETLDRPDAPRQRPAIDAYVTLQSGSDAADVRDTLARMLPDYMIPTTITPVDAIPLNASGKLDRARLPAPAHPRQAHRRGSRSGRPRTDTSADITGGSAT
jgi:acyl-coenzyme A synthetase/AMP-(fatty) acid ligase